jgi:hypothetical protein
MRIIAIIMTTAIGPLGGVSRVDKKEHVKNIAQRFQRRAIYFA